MTTTTTVHAAILQALRNREMGAAAALICHLAQTDPEAAQRIRDAIDEVEARNRARRGAAQLAEFMADEERVWRDAMNREYWR